MSTFGGDEVGSLVLDMGSSLCKGGYSGEDTPKAIFPTDYALVADPEKEGARKIIVGEGEITCPRPEVEIRNPMKGGLISDWEAMEKIWDYMFLNRLRVNTQEHPVLLSEPSYNTKEVREKYAEIFFEKYNVPGLYVCKDAVLSAFSAGRATALVLDSGADITRAVPVHDGYVLKKNIVKQQFGGDDMTREVLKYLEEKMSIDMVPYYKIQEKHVVAENKPHNAKLKEYPFKVSDNYHHYMKLRLANEFKESLCSISDSRFNEQILGTLPTRLFEFPTGFNTSFGVDRYRLAEPLFNASMTFASRSSDAMEVDDEKGKEKEKEKEGGKPATIQKLVHDSISKCDHELRVNLFANVIVTGGNSMFPGFPERLANELSQLAPSYRTRITAPPNAVERKFSSWIGGSILTSLGSFHQMWISKAEYEETGKIVVEKKCP